MKPVKKPEFGGTHADVCIAIGENLMLEQYETYLKSEECRNIVAKKLMNLFSVLVYDEVLELEQLTGRVKQSWLIKADFIIQAITGGE